MVFSLVGRPVRSLLSGIWLLSVVSLRPAMGRQRHTMLRNEIRAQGLTQHRVWTKTEVTTGARLRKPRAEEGSANRTAADPKQGRREATDHRGAEREGKGKKKELLTNDAGGGHSTDYSSCGGSWCGGPPSRKTKTVTAEAEGRSPAADIESGSPKPPSLDAETDINNTNTTDNTADNTTDKTTDNTTDNTTDGNKARDEQDVVCDLTKPPKPDKKSSLKTVLEKMGPRLVRFVRAKSPVADYLRQLGPEYQRIPSAADYAPASWTKPKDPSQLGGGKNELSNDWAFKYFYGTTGTCVRADKGKAKQLAKEWRETSRKRRPQTEAARGFEGNATLQSILVHDTTTAMFALELMRPSSCDLAAQHEAASEAAHPAWVLGGHCFRNVLSALLFTNGQLAGLSYLARKGINFVPSTVTKTQALESGLQWLRPTVTYASPLSWFEKGCPRPNALSLWHGSFSYAFRPLWVAIVGEVVDVTGLGLKVNSYKRKKYPTSFWSKCERTMDRTNIRGIILVRKDQATDKVRDAVVEALLAAQKTAGQSYDLALSTLKEFSASVGLKFDLHQYNHGVVTPDPSQDPIPAHKLMAWQKKYRLDKKTLKCEGEN